MGSEQERAIGEIERESAEFGGTGGVAAKHLGTGEEIRVNADAVTATASTIKVPILIELFRQVEAGEVCLEDRLAVTEATRARGSGVLRELSPDIELTVRDHATLMIVVSDNTSTNVLIDVVGLERVNSRIHLGSRSSAS